ncbi:12931_t:CDS:2, partial [Racocetra fulgida]
AEALETCNSSGNELNDVEDREISILRSKEADNVITRLMQAVPEVTTHWPLVYIENSIRTKRRRKQMHDTISSDSNSETFGSDSEVEIAESYNIMSLENLNNTIKQLKKEIKSNKHSEIVKAHLYTMLSYFHLVEHGRKRIEPSIIVAEAAEKGVYHARMYMDGYKRTDVVAYCERFLERMVKFEAHIVVFSSENIEEETRPDFDDIIILQPLCKKGQGQSVHISEFLTNIGGRLALHYKNPNLYGESKGLKQILGERGLWRDEMRLACKRGCEQGRTDCAIE